MSTEARNVGACSAGRVPRRGRAGGPWRANVPFISPIGEVVEGFKASPVPFTVIHLHGTGCEGIEERTGSVWNEVREPETEGLRTAGKIVDFNVARSFQTSSMRTTITKAPPRRPSGDCLSPRPHLGPQYGLPHRVLHSGDRGNGVSAPERRTVLTTEKAGVLHRDGPKPPFSEPEGPCRIIDMRENGRSTGPRQSCVEGIEGIPSREALTWWRTG